MIDPKKAIVFDADVLIHFDKAERLNQLQHIFPNNRKIILDKVVSELRNPRLQQALHYLVSVFKAVEVLPFPNDSRMKLEYALLSKTRGAGESACMAYCRFSHDIIASSNLSDIKAYCEKNGIAYLTTMDFVYEAYVSGLWGEEECDDFIRTVLRKGSKLPFASFGAYLLFRGKM